MSRAIGDEISQTVGVIPTPFVQKIPLTDKEKFLLLCTDGV